MAHQSIIESPEAASSETTLVEDIYQKAGWAFPAGPLIPRPDAHWAPLWPGLLQPNLSRLKAVSDVLVLIHEPETLKLRIAALLDTSCRNWWRRCYPQDPANTASASLAVLEFWIESLQRDHPRYEKVFQDLVNDKLKPAIRKLHAQGRKNARAKPLLFCPPLYPAVAQGGGTSEPTKTKAREWGKYDPAIQAHVRSLLDEPAGEWSVLTLLFLKLLHAHLGWILPAQQIREDRMNYTHRAVLGHLRQCALHIDEVNRYPHADIAAGLLQTIPRVNLLLNGDPGYPQHPDELDPRDARLPDSLHIDSCMSAAACIHEVKQILAWMTATSQDPKKEEWDGLQSWVDDVATLAWDMASARTDPFALGGLGIAQNNPFATRKIIEFHREAMAQTQRGCNAFVRHLHSEEPITRWVHEDGCQIPSVFLKDGIDAIPQIEHIVVVGGQLRSAYGWLETALASYGLSKYQQFTSEEHAN